MQENIAVSACIGLKIVDFINSSSHPIMASAKKRAALKHKQIKSGRSEQSAMSTSALHTDNQTDINYEITCLRFAENRLLECHIDNLSESRYSTKTGKLHLQFHILALQAKGAIKEFSLEVLPLGAEQGLRREIKAIAINSPVMAANYPDLEWAKNCRFAVDTIIDVPNLKLSDTLSILADTGNSSHTIARLIPSPLASKDLPGHEDL